MSVSISDEKLSEMDNSTRPVFWLERIAFRKQVPYRKQPILLLPLIIVLGHFAISMFTGGLDRFWHDLGLILVVLGWWAVLWAIANYTAHLRELSSVVDGISEIQHFILGKGTYLFGLFGVIISAWNFWVKHSASESFTGWIEFPYDGSWQFAMKYTSIPASLWGSAFWTLFDFIAGGILWMCIANILAMRRISRESKLEIDLFDTDRIKKSRAIGSTALAATLMPAAGLILSPLALTAGTRLYPYLWFTYLWGYVVYTLFLTAIFGLSAYYVHRSIDQRKQLYLDQINERLASVHRSIWSKPSCPVTDTYYRQLFWLQSAKSFVTELGTWPFDSEIAVSVVLTLLSPALTVAAQFVLGLVLGVGVQT
jgi:hypothetical protein